MWKQNKIITVFILGIFISGTLTSILPNYSNAYAYTQKEDSYPTPYNSHPAPDMEEDQKYECQKGPFEGFFVSSPEFCKREIIQDPPENSPIPVEPAINKSYTIDNSIKPSIKEAERFNDNISRPVGVIVGPDGTKDEFVVNEVIINKTINQNVLNNFLQKYNGKILSNGILPSIEGIDQANASSFRGDYLVRVNLNLSTLDDLDNNIKSTIKGPLIFSSEDTARLAALILREGLNELSLFNNFIMKPNSILEHPNNDNKFIDFSKYVWMSEDSVLSVGVEHAWDYLKYMNLPPPPLTGGAFSPSKIAIIEAGGFALDETTGIPLNNNLDYLSYGPFLEQIGLLFRDNGVIQFGNSAGGISTTPCSGGTPCPWHGQGTFGVAAAYPRNGYGAAGTGGEVVTPLLIKMGDGHYNAAIGIVADCNGRFISH